MKSEEFDTRVRAALKQREIEPAAELWERLEANLESNPGSNLGSNPGSGLEAELGSGFEADPEKNRGKSATFHSWRWVAAAAVMVVLLFSITWFAPGTGERTLPVVEQDGFEVIPEQRSPGERPAGESADTPIPVIVTPEEVAVVRPKMRSGMKSDMNNSATVSDAAAVADVGVAVADADADATVAQAASLSPSDTGNTVLETVAEAAVVANAPAGDVHADGVNATGVPNLQRDPEVEALLAEAMRKLEHMPADDRRRVDAEALLADVEEELDRNFKDKALDAIRKKIVKLRSAVANNEQ